MSPGEIAFVREYMWAGADVEWDLRGGPGLETKAWSWRGREGAVRRRPIAGGPRAEPWAPLDGEARRAGEVEGGLELLSHSVCRAHSGNANTEFPLED